MAINIGTVKLDWLSIFVIIVTVTILIVICYKHSNRESFGNLRIYPAKEARQGVAVDQKSFYAIADNTIGKYSRRTGKRKLHQKLPFDHLNGGKIVGQPPELLLTNNPKGKPDLNALVWLDSEDLSIRDVSSLPLSGSLTWADIAFGRLWVCSAHYGRDLPKTRIQCYNKQKELVGEWGLPKKLLKRLAPWSLSGGAWYGQKLFVAGHDSPEAYVLDLPPDAENARVTEIIPVCFDGQGFSVESVGKGASKRVSFWGIHRKSQEVVNCIV